MKVSEKQIEVLQEEIAEKQEESFKKKAKAVNGLDCALDSVRYKIAASNIGDKNEILKQFDIAISKVKEEAVKSRENDLLAKLVEALSNRKGPQGDLDTEVEHSAHYAALVKKLQDKRATISNLPIRTVGYYLQGGVYILYVEGEDVGRRKPEIRGILELERRSEVSWCFAVKPSPAYIKALAAEMQNDLIAGFRTLMSPELHVMEFTCSQVKDPLQKAIQIFNKNYADEYGVLLVLGKQIVSSGNEAELDEEG